MKRTFLNAKPRIIYAARHKLDSEALDLLAEAADGTGELTALVAGDAGGDNRAADTASSAKGDLALNVHIGHVLVLAEERKMEENGEGYGVGGENDQLRNTAVQRLGGLVGTLLQLAEVGSLLNHVEDLLLKGSIGQGPGGAFGSHCVDVTKQGCEGIWEFCVAGFLAVARPGYYFVRKVRVFVMLEKLWFSAVQKKVSPSLKIPQTGLA